MYPFTIFFRRLVMYPKHFLQHTLLHIIHLQQYTSRFYRGTHHVSDNKIILVNAKQIMHIRKISPPVDRNTLFIVHFSRRFHFLLSAMSVLPLECFFNIIHSN